MNQKELRLGNYFMGGLDEFLEVTAIYHNGVDYKNGSNKGCCTFLGMKPILISEEWLMKLGFENTYDDGIWLFEDFRVDYDGHAGYGLHLRLGVFLRGVDAVHQLQNLYFALTGTELTLKPESI